MTESNPVAKYQFPGIIKGNGAEKPWITHTSWRHQAYESIRNELRTKGRLLTQETCGTRPSSPLMIIAILCRLYSVLTDIYTYICIRSQSLIFDLRGGPFIRLFALTCDRRVLCHSVSRTAAHRSVIRSVFFLYSSESCMWQRYFKVRSPCYCAHPARHSGVTRPSLASTILCARKTRLPCIFLW